MRHFIYDFAISFSFSSEVDYKSTSLDKLLKKQDASWYLRGMQWLMQIYSLDNYSLDNGVKWASKRRRFLNF